MVASNVVTGIFSGFVENEPKLQPIQALLFYNTSTGGFNGASSLVATSHPLTLYKGRSSPEIGAGHVLSDADTREVLESMLDKIPQYSGFIPTDVLSISSNHIAWTVKASVRNLYFKPRGRKNTLKWTVPVPTLLFVASTKGLSIAAVKTKRRPTEKTALYHAPLMNIYNDGRVCLGSASYPSEISPDTRPSIEDCIFKTNFAHINHNKTLAIPNKKEISDKQHLAFWRTLHKEKANTFPPAALSKMPVNVGQFISTFSK
jgi:PRTRC genetic system protein B